MGSSELIEDIKAMRMAVRAYEHDDDSELMAEVVSYVPKLLDLADLLVTMLQDEEIDAEKPEKIDDEQEVMSSEMMILKGAQLIQDGMSIQKSETEIVFSHLMSGKLVAQNIKNDLSGLYAAFNTSPNSVIDVYLSELK